MSDEVALVVTVQDVDKAEAENEDEEYDDDDDDDDINCNHIPGLVGLDVALAEVIEDVDEA